MKKFTAILLILSALVLAAACDEGAYTGKAGAPLVAAQGDSVTANSSSQLHAVLGGSYQVRLAATIGETSDQAQGGGFVDDAKVIGATNPWAAIVQLGTNDTRTLWPTQTTLDNIDYIWAQYPDSTCKITVTISEIDTGTYGPPESVPQVNQLARDLNTVLRTRPHLVDWAKAINADHALVVDGVHPSLAGKKKLAQLYKKAVDGCKT